MSKQALEWFNALWAHDIRLAPTAYRILERLVSCHTEARGCYPSQAYIARAVKVSLRTVNTHLSRLERQGLVAREPRGHNRRGVPATTRYHFPFEPGFERFRHPASRTDESRGALGGVLSDKHADSASGLVHKLQTSPEGGKQETHGHRRSGQIVEACINVCGPGLCSRSQRLIRDTDYIIAEWLQQGFCLEKDILPALRKGTRRVRCEPIRTWSYFTNAVAEAHARRMAGEVPGSAIGTPPEAPSPMARSIAPPRVRGRK